MLCTAFDFGDSSIDICLLYCIVFVCFIGVLCVFLISFMSDCCVTEFEDLRNYMCVCMYVCTCTTPEIWFGHWLPDFFFFFSAPISSHLTPPLSWQWIPKLMQLLCYKFYLQTCPVSTDFFYQFYITNNAKKFSCKLHRSVENRRKHTVWFSGYSQITLFLLTQEQLKYKENKAI